MGFCCVSCEVLYLSIYAICHPRTPTFSLRAPHAFGSVVQWVTGCACSNVDLLPAALVLLTLPGCVVKQVVNVYQLRGAMVKLVALERNAT
jgi:hypothetical protein